MTGAIRAIGESVCITAPTISTPVDPALPQVELTANVIDNIVNGRYLVRPPFMVTIEAVFILLFAVFAEIKVITREQFFKA